MTTKFRAQFDGKALIPLEPVDLPTGQVLEIEASESDAARAGSPRSILRVMHGLPAISSQDVDELLRGIEAAQLPAVDEDLFGDEKE